MIRIGMIIPIGDDPTSWYRGVGPMSVLQKMYPNEIQCLFVNPVNWATVKFCDILFMQRPALPDHYQQMLLAKDLSKPIWIDFDDDNLSVPKDNPMYGLYSQMPVKDAIVRMSRAADMITVSTETLKKKYQIYNPNVTIVPNALDDCLMKLRTLSSKPREKSILWRGTMTHTKNLRVIQKEVIEVAANHPDHRFIFFGYDPIDITENIKNHQCVPTLPILEFHKQMVAFHSKALYYSLSDNDHSQSRSHVCWLEASFASTMTIAPNVPEFQKPGIMTYNNPSEFKDILTSTIKDEIDVEKKVTESWEAIQQSYLLSKVNSLRYEVVKKLQS